MQGAEATRLFADYSGTWMLDTVASDVPSRPARGSGQGGRGGGDPFGGGGGRGGRGAPPGGGGPPPGGAGGSGGPGGGRGFGGPAINPAALEATMELAFSRPSRIYLDLSDSLFVVTQTPGVRLALPMGGDESEVELASWPTTAKVAWDDRRPRVERSVENGGRIIDRYELVTPRRLVITRTLDGAPGGDLELRFAYDREGTD